MQKNKDQKTGVILTFVIFFMLAFAYACVPLYRLFCQKTGFAGTPKIVQMGSTKIGSRIIKVQFVGNVHRDLRWDFTPLQDEITIRVGQNALAFYRAKNLTKRPIIGMSTYNVSPDKAAPYFNKVACFCFERQLLSADEEMDMPVQFYIDPDIVNDPDLNDVHLITLSYTFFEIKS